MTQKHYWIIALNIIILLGFPALSPFHYDPLPEFFAETCFAWASISIFLITLFAYKELTVPRITIPLLLLAIFLFVQNKLVNIDFVGLSYVAGMEMILCVLLSVTFSTLIHKFGLKTVVNTICFAIFIGAFMQSIIGILQYTGMCKIFGNILFYDSLHPTDNIFGHFGQRNHYCHYLSWAVFGLIYLYHNHKIKLPVFLVFVMWFIFSMTIASSRSVFIYFTFASFISLLYYLKNKTPEAKKLFLLILITSLALILVESSYPHVAKLFSHSPNINTGLQRITVDYDN